MKKCAYCFKLRHDMNDCPYMFRWNQQRVLWIGHNENDCVLNKIPREILREIISYCGVNVFQDMLEFLKKFKSVKSAFEPQTIIGRGVYLTPEIIEKYFGKLECYTNSNDYPFCIGQKDISNDEYKIFKSYGCPKLVEQ